MKDLETAISKKIGKAIYQYKMIEENDSILVAVSGGKDSMTLLYDLCKRQKSFPINYKIIAVHIMTDFCTCSHKSRIEDKFKEFGVEYKLVKVDVLKRIKPDKKMNCYWCSSQRRMELINIARETGCNKIALGHHMDDIIETFLLNIFFKSEISTMLPALKYDKYPYVIIRPLSFVKEEEIIRFAKSKQFNSLICECPYGKKSKRKEIKKLITKISKNNKSIRENIFNSMKSINKDYLLEK